MCLYKIMIIIDQIKSYYLKVKTNKIKYKKNINNYM